MELARMRAVVRRARGLMGEVRKWRISRRRGKSFEGNERTTGISPRLVALQFDRRMRSREALFSMLPFIAGKPVCVNCATGPQSQWDI
jgi:hypothetical protein